MEPFFKVQLSLAVQLKRSSNMKYIFIIVSIFIFSGCFEDNKKDEAQKSVNSSISDTKSLQPDIKNSEMQPPRPPAL